MINRLRELFRRSPRPEAEPLTEGDGGSAFGRAEAAAWLAAMESGKLAIPHDVHDAQAWDRYWSAQIEVGGMIEQGFSDMMSSDAQFIPELAQRGVRTILCAGNGLSTEPLVLALHGFKVTTLDLSTIPRAFVAAIIANPGHLFHGVPGFTVRGDAAFSFESDCPIDPGVCPQMHRTEGHPPTGGGSLAAVTGDLTNTDICPGPFDAVIERRTVQLFNGDERPAALGRLVARLGPRGMFVSQQHVGCWKPQEPREHFGNHWLRKQGFVARGSPEADSAARVAWLVFTTG